VRDPELRSTGSGQSAANFRVADDGRWRNQGTQEWQETTTYVDVVAWAGSPTIWLTHATKGTASQ
jgi:single-stranded DNA-binding protein